jgi:hypothetical protein
MEDHSQGSRAKSGKLTVVQAARGLKRQTRIRQAGVLPTEGMPPGKYKVVCEAARIISKWGKSVAELSFRIVEGDHFGTVLPGWISLHMIGDVVYPGRYTQQCAAALGHEIEPGDDIDPEAVFVGKMLLVDVRFRSTDGKSRSPEDTNRKKDKKDFLRVCSILGIGEL